MSLKELRHLGSRSRAVGDCAHAKRRHAEPEQAAMVVQDGALIAGFHSRSQKNRGNMAAAMRVVGPGFVDRKYQYAALLELRVRQ